MKSETYLFSKHPIDAVASPDCRLIGHSGLVEGMTGFTIIKTWQIGRVNGFRHWGGLI
jgi:hypothetical protein